MVDLKTFDLWLKHRRYFKDKLTRQTIIRIYKKDFNSKSSILEFEKHLDGLGFDELIYLPISRYVTNWNFREEENNLLRKELKNGK